MKAAVIEEPGLLSVHDIPMPQPGAYEVLCELLFGATCTGTDLHLINYDPPFCGWINLPAIPGHESIGRVVETGPKVRNFKTGDLLTRVGAPASAGLDAAWGGFAEFGISAGTGAPCVKTVCPSGSGSRIRSIKRCPPISTPPHQP